MAILLHDHQQVIPPTVLLAPVVADSTGPAVFGEKLRQAQEADPHDSSVSRDQSTTVGYTRPPTSVSDVILGRRRACGSY